MVHWKKHAGILLFIPNIQYHEIIIYTNPYKLSISPYIFMCNIRTVSCIYYVLYFYYESKVIE